MVSRRRDEEQPGYPFKAKPPTSKGTVLPKAPPAPPFPYTFMEDESSAKHSIQPGPPRSVWNVFA